MQAVQGRFAVASYKAIKMMTTHDNYRQNTQQITHRQPPIKFLAEPTWDKFWARLTKLLKKFGEIYTLGQ